MVADTALPLTSEDPDEIKPIILENIQAIFTKLKVIKVFFIDDAINQDTGKDTFKGLVQSIIAKEKFDDLRAITMSGIDFTVDETVMLDHIDKVWDDLKHSKQLRYFEKVYTIAGNPTAITDLNVSNKLKDFFNAGQIDFLTPNEWDVRYEQILAEVPPGNKIFVIFDQDLKLAQGRYSEQLIQGEQLILELKQKNVEEKVIISLLTHTITACEDELPKRAEICERLTALEISDFFVLAKVRLEKPAMFADGLKKIALNTFCENIKSQTIGILKDAQTETIRQLLNFDTYDFDHTVFKSSHLEGVWEPETLLRISDVIFKDEVRKLMIERHYLLSTNPAICSANEISKIEFIIDDEPGNPYKERFKLRTQEIYESGILLNSLRKPIDNGDIFTIKEGVKKGKTFILVAQECDLMVRGQNGERGARSATLLEIETLSEKQLLDQMKKKYSNEIEREKFKNHFFSDKYKLEYIESGTNKVGLVHFSKAIVIDLNVLDLIVFNENGEAILDLAAETFDEKLHNSAWKNRYELIRKEFTSHRDVLERQYTAVECIEDPDLKLEIKTKINYLFSFINSAGILLSYDSNKFSFGLNRISRLRQPKSRNLLDRYYQHLSRIAEPHDFAM